MLAPKRKNEDAERKDAGFFDYYAAFSHAFVDRVFTRLDLPPNGMVLDPWNGRGTTTTVAAERRLTSLGFDLNPVMVAIADARLVAPSLAETALKRVKKMRTVPATVNGHARALEGWFIPSAAGDFSAVRNVLEQIACTTAEDHASSAERVNQKRRLRAFLFLSLAAALRRIAEPIQTSNPTWIRERVPLNERLRPSKATIWEFTQNAAAESIAKLSTTAEVGRVFVSQADSRRLPLRSACIDAIVTSPPYCTRIDYAVATRPELAIFLDVDALAFRSLRDRLIGTTTISLEHAYAPPAKWGAVCVSTLESIRTHTSKASATYYLRNFLQYFDGLHSSLKEINRVAKPQGAIALVIQDSYYKNIHIDLTSIVLEMCHAFGWTLEDREDHEQATTLAASNPKARAYRKSFRAIESVLYLRKGGSV